MNFLWCGNRAVFYFVPKTFMITRRKVSAFFVRFHTFFLIRRMKFLMSDGRLKCLSSQYGDGLLLLNYFVGGYVRVESYHFLAPDNETFRNSLQHMYMRSVFELSHNSKNQTGTPCIVKHFIFI